MIVLTSLWEEIEPFVQAFLGEAESDLDLNRIPLPLVTPRSKVTPRLVREVLSQPRTGEIAENVAVPERVVKEVPVDIRPQPSISDPALAQRVDELKLRYIVGKVAGKDLVDTRGQLIAQRGEKLTAAVVEAADRAGKLVELIVNMVIDDLGE